VTQLIRPQFDRGPSSTLAYLRLMRLPNVFTAIADIAMGFVFVHDMRQGLLAGLRDSWPSLVLLMAASSLLYTAGMIWNDVFDLEVDRRERPFRPLPAGQISLTSATRLGMLMLVAGVLLAALAGWVHRPQEVSPWRSGIVAALLALAVLAYDAWLKNTPLGPLGMGLCRFLNVLLGMSAAGFASPPEESFLSYHASSWLVAAGFGIYITGVTWFARSEATSSNRTQLTLATVVMMVGIGLIALLPVVPQENKPLRLPTQFVFLLFGVLALPTLRRALGAIQDPQPENVQGVVKHCIMSLIVLNAAVAMITSSPEAGLAIAALLAPMLLLGRWVYST
jgi:4-hydroxybenzoate polyprenyltransferase